MANEIKRRFEEWFKSPDRVHPELYYAYTGYAALVEWLDSFEGYRLIKWDETKGVEISSMPDANKGEIELPPQTVSQEGFNQGTSIRFEQLEKRLAALEARRVFDDKCDEAEHQAKLEALEADVKALNNIVNEMSETEEIKKRI